MTQANLSFGGVSAPSAIPGGTYLDRCDAYDGVRGAIAYITEHALDQPDIETIARAVGEHPAVLTRKFRAFAGLTPKAFLQAVTLDRAKALLDAGEPVLDAAYGSGLSGPGRLHDLFVTHQAMPPGAYRAKGAGLEVRYGFHPTPFGTALVMLSEHGLVGLAFCDPGGEEACLEDMSGRWPAADYRRDDDGTRADAQRIFDPELWQADQPIRITLIGTDFEVRVWETLLAIPLGRTTTYGAIAKHIGKDSASRAVGAAVGKNPISFVVPCHRAVGATGHLTGYHWGLTRKRAMLGWEAASVGKVGADAQGALAF
ncbi:MAG: bifunctional helix-turn-helix domain-containing protein/methylated-DNA--[protein]-cysteine S-methyltransferase [Devosiaceae bacterium]|nr:bifunctional helix-turn-helix domain-containing protein/methylated-DNA--[protein]-cysteine S-methyltransferase [Devosiaceae bacterium MH13]